MNVLFWLCWLANALLVLIAMLGKGFRDSFGAGSLINMIMGIVLMSILAGSLILRFGLKQKGWSLILVLLPLAAMCIWYLIDRKQS